jgi:uncharacterized membrane protein YkvA (DUF1232 family)
MTELKDTLYQLRDKAKTVAGDPVLLARYLARLMKDDRVPKGAKLKLIASGLYTWVDGDLIPDTLSMIPGLGYVDDAILLVHGVKCLIAETDKNVAVELWPGDEESFRRVMAAVSWLDDQLYENIRGWVKDKISRFTDWRSSVAKIVPKG